jgi:hypothetical protein
MGRIDPTKPFSHIIKDYRYDSQIDSEVSYFILQFCDGTKTHITHNAALAMRKFCGVEKREWDDDNRPFNSPRTLTQHEIWMCRKYNKEQKEKGTTPVEDVVKYIWN